MSTVRDGLAGAVPLVLESAQRGVGAHFVEGGLVRAADLLAEGAGLRAGIYESCAWSQWLPLTPTLSPLAGRGRSGRVAAWDGAVGARAHVVKRRLANT